MERRRGADGIVVVVAVGEEDEEDGRARVDRGMAGRAGSATENSVLCSATAQSIPEIRRTSAGSAGKDGAERPRDRGDSDHRRVEEPAPAAPAKIGPKGQGTKVT